MSTNAFGRVPPAALPARQAGLTRLALIMVIAVAVLLIGGGVAALYATGVVSGSPADATEGVAEGERNKQPKPALYLPLEPPIVVNFGGKPRGGYLQVGVELMTREPAVIDAMKTHMPVVRNNLILMFGDQHYDDLTSRAGKERLRRDALAAVNEVLANHDVDEQVEAVYFTSFILQ